MPTYTVKLKDGTDVDVKNVDSVDIDPRSGDIRLFKDGWLNQPPVCMGVFSNAQGAYPKVR